MKFAGKAGQYQRKAVVTAAGAAVLGAAPTLAMTHGHRWLGFAFIAMQVVLLVAAVRFFVEMKKAKAAEEHAGPAAAPKFRE